MAAPKRRSDDMAGRIVAVASPRRAAQESVKLGMGELAAQRHGVEGLDNVKIERRRLQDARRDFIGDRGMAGSGFDIGVFRSVAIDAARSPAISALLLGLALGVFARTEPVLESFYEPLFRGLLSILMLIMGMEAWSRLAELRRVALVYAPYAAIAPIAHGMAGLAVGIGVHHLTGFSAGGVVFLAVMAASNSDISGPPTLRGALPEANPSAYVGASTAIGTPVAILSIPLFIALAEFLIGAEAF